ncbi:hypothetical protein LUZ60_008262 [Juncus effusus]|nr:hypothetical protein LUZ60_008262 [Juncus effusus]
MSFIANLKAKIFPAIHAPSTRSNVAKEMEKLSKLIPLIRAMLSDAEHGEMPGEFGQLWLHELKQLAYDAEDLQSDFYYEVSTELECKLQAGHMKGNVEVCDVILSPTSSALFLGRIKDIMEKYDEICRSRDALSLREEDGFRRPQFTLTFPSSSFVDPSEIVGRETEKKELVHALVTDDEPTSSRVEVVAIVAMGGMGKTTVAKLVFNDELVEKHFQLRVWVWVSKSYDEIAVTRSILEAITNQAWGLCQLDALQCQLRKELTYKRFLIVLDDLWNDDRNRWDLVKGPLIFGAKGSRILITIRNSYVAASMRTKLSFPLGGLSVVDSWSLFCHQAFSGMNPNDAPSYQLMIGQMIAEKCNGVPLVIKILGGLLASISIESFWEDILRSHLLEIEECKTRIMPILELSYQCLPPPIKDCFRWCAMYPKGFEFESDNLVRLWVAHDMIQVEESKQMEVGRSYIDDLLQRSFFQNKVTRGAVFKFTMHDLMHDLAKHIVKDETFIVENGECNIDETSRHLTIIVKKDSHVSLEPFQVWIPLRSLFIQSYNHASIHIDESFFNYKFLKYLRILDLNSCKLKELPESIINLTNLRYLRLSGQSLPESICSLQNLQTLDTGTSGNQINLPKSLDCLSNLRHLIISAWDIPGIPVGIGRLTNLHTLSAFVVGKEKGSATLNELRNLYNLHGELQIMGLHHAFQDRQIERMNPDLKSKKNLTHLTFSWSTFMSAKAVNNDQKVLEILRPHTNIEHVVVDGYRGAQFANWLADPTFCNLTYLKLDRCMNCVQLPAIGQLPALKHLKLERLEGLRILDGKFFGNHAICFASLEVMCLYDMPQLENWWYGVENEIAFPRLRELHVTLCHKLKSIQISDLPALQRVDIIWCDNLARVDGLSPQWIVSEHWCGVVNKRIGHSKSGNSVFKFDFLSGGNSHGVPKRMRIIGCPLLMGLSKDPKSTSLEDHQNIVLVEEPGEASTSAGPEISESMQLASNQKSKMNNYLPPGHQIWISTGYKMTKGHMIISEHSSSTLMENNAASLASIVQFGEVMQHKSVGESRHEGMLSKEMHGMLGDDRDSSANTLLHVWANSIRNTFLSGFSIFGSLPVPRNNRVQEVKRTSL